jgi:hypothetical protein
METPREGGERDVEEIDVFGTDDNKDKGGGEGAAPEGEQRQVANDADRDQAAPARGEDDTRQDARDDRQDDDRQDRDRDPPRRRDESDDDYSRRVRGRINRERALRLRSDRRVDELTIANSEMRERLARLERTQKASNIEGDAAKKLDDLKKKIDECTTRLAAAKEGGDTAKELQIQIELTDLLAEKKIIEKRTEFLANEARNAAAAGDPGAGAGEDEPDPEKKRIARATSKWQRENRNWWNLRRFSDVRTDAVELDKELRLEVSDGKLDMEEYSDEYFAELSARLKDLYPDLDVRGLDGERVEAESEDLDRDARNRDDDRDLERGRGRERDRDDRGSRRPAPPRRHAAGNMGSNDRRRGNSDARTLAEQGRVRLTPADHAQMREYGLDPNSPKDKKAFAKERMRTILSEGRDQGRGGAR